MLTAFVPVLSESSALGADRYFDYRIENYAEALSDAPVDHVIDTLGETEFARELSVLKPGGRLLSLRGAPNAELLVVLVCRYSNARCSRSPVPSLTA